MHGTTGRLAWDYRRMGELRISRGPSVQDQPVSTVFVGPGAGHYEAFQPGSANAMSYDDLKVIEARDLLASVAQGRSCGADLTAAVRAGLVLDALVTSSASGSRVDVPAV